MAKFSAEERREILAAFARCRRREILISLPILSGVFTLVLLYRNPGYQIAGFGGLPLALVAGTILAAGLVLHVRNWRCPSCRRPLRQRASFCRRCGAVFVA